MNKIDVLPRLGTIEGKVIDDKGNGIEGIKIGIYGIDKLKLYGATTPITTTEPDGSFTFGTAYPTGYDGFQGYFKVENMGNNSGTVSINQYQYDLDADGFTPKLGTINSGGDTPLTNGLLITLTPDGNDNLEITNKCNCMSKKNEAVCFKSNVPATSATTTITHDACSDTINLEPGVYEVSYSASVKPSGCYNTAVQLALTLDGTVEDGSQTIVYAGKCDIKNIAKTVIVDASATPVLPATTHSLQLISVCGGCMYLLYPTVTVVKLANVVPTK